MNLQHVAIINDSQIVGHTPSKLYLPGTDHVVLCYTKGLCRPLSGVYHITGRRRKKRLSRYNYYFGPTKDTVLIQDPALIQNPAFIFVIMLFLPATK